MLTTIIITTAWPVNKTCDRILEKGANNNDPDILAEALGYAIGVFYNNTGDHSCYDIKRYPHHSYSLYVSKYTEHGRCLY
jgi:hypothetical protein